MKCLTSWKPNWTKRGTRATSEHNTAQPNTAKLLGALGLARRAGALAIGFDAVEQAIKTGRAQLVLVASDTSPKTRKRLEVHCKNNTLPTQLGLTKDELAQITVKPAGVLAITNKDLAALCHKALAGKEETV